MNRRKITTRQGSQSSTQALTLKGQLQSNKMTKGDNVTTFFMKDLRGQRSTRCYWRNHILKYVLIYIYIYYLYHCYEGNCRTKKPFAEVMDLKGISVHSEEQHTGSENSRFDCCNCHSSNLYF
jgi:hypothetical protein